ncbi:hypothetical protein FI667_g11337, partial [Globisporangium splendens]
MTLFCALVGAKGSAFPVDIDASQSVGHLKEAIKTKKQSKIKCDADELQLYLGKIGDGAWLGFRDAHVKALLAGTIPDEISDLFGEEIDPTKKIGAVFAKAPANEAIHVLVVVPKQEVVPPVSQDAAFAPCDHEFFSQFAAVDEVDSWLEFSSLIPLTKLRRFHIRSSYKVIAEQVLSNAADPRMVKYAVVSGTPGIGKSVFVYYVLWKLIKEKKRVLLVTNVPVIYFDGDKMWERWDLPGKCQIWSPDLWCLVDSADPTAIARMPVNDCSVLLVSTPRKDYIGEFKKLAPKPDVFYMPLWTHEELSAIAPLYPDARDVWVNRFECLGGVPRLVLKDIETTPDALLLSACNSCSIDDCIMLVSIYSDINSKTKILQTLIHIWTENPYREYQVTYASDLAVKVIAQTKWRRDRLKMQSLLGSCDGNPLAQSLCGYIFEPHSMDLLERGGCFIYRKLYSYAEMRKQETIKRKRGTPDSEHEETIDIPESPQPRQIAERVELEQFADQLYVPRTSNYTAIDAWMPNFGGFQMTVGKKHEIKGGASDDLRKLGSQGNRLFFLLPPRYYKSFTKKTPQTIEQYGILIPYPDEV